MNSKVDLETQRNQMDVQEHMGGTCNSIAFLQVFVQIQRGVECKFFSYSQDSKSRSLE